MGQYWIPVNLDKKEFICPHKLGSGLKLWEQLASSPGTGGALIVLTAAMPEARGGGDLSLRDESDEAYTEIAEQTIGRWAGDRIALVGDYADADDLPAEFEADKIFDQCEEDGEYTDITHLVCAVIEHELEGEFDGGGWKDFVRNE